MRKATIFKILVSILVLFFTYPLTIKATAKATAGTSVLDYAERCESSDLNELECAPELYEKYPEISADDLAKVILAVWQNSLSYPEMREVLQKCKKQNDEPAYTEEEINKAISLIFEDKLAEDPLIDELYTMVPVSASSFLEDLRYSKWESLEEVTKCESNDNIIDLETEDNKKARLYFYSPGIIRVRFNQAGDYKNDYSYAVLDDFKTQNKIKGIECKKEDNYYVVKTEELEVRIKIDGFAISVLKDTKEIHSDDEKKGIAWRDERVVSFKKMKKGAHFYGFGEKTGLSINKARESMTMWSFDAYEYSKTSDPIYGSYPFFIEINPEEDYAYAIFFDNPSQTFFNMGKNFEDKYYFGSLYGEMDYYFIYGKHAKEIVKSFTSMTGRMQMPPKYVLGFQQSKFSYYTDREVYWITDQFRNKKIPLDVIYLDVDFAENYKEFTWDKRRFPKVEDFFTEMHRRGVKLGTNITPGIRSDDTTYDAYMTGLEEDIFLRFPSENGKPGDIVTGQIEYSLTPPKPTVYPDFTRQDVRKWWGEQYKPLVDIGMDIIWNDMNDPAIAASNSNFLKTLPFKAVHDDFGRKSYHIKVHNIYCLEMVRGTSEGMDELRKNKRNFVLTRAGYPGVQRYAGIWTGDNASDWDHLKMNITMPLNLGLTGVPIVGADIGGFTGNLPSRELFARWIQLGAFIPFYRDHYDKTKKGFQEPWAFEKKNQAFSVEDISRKYIEMRYQLMPYFYDFVYESHKTGLPIVRPLFMEFPDDSKTYENADTEFMFGDSMLIAPVVVHLLRSSYPP